MADVDKDAVEAVRIGQPEPAFGLEGGWLFLTVGHGEGSVHVRNYWQGLLIGGAYRDAAKTEGYPALRGLSVGAPDEEPTAAVIEGPNPSPTSLSAIQIEARVRDKAATMATEVSSLEFLETDFPAPIVVLRTTDPVRFLQDHPSPSLELFGDLTSYAGTYLEVVTEGEVFLAQAFVGRTGQGAEWIRPDLADDAFHLSDVSARSSGLNRSTASDAFHLSDASARSSGLNRSKRTNPNDR